MSSNLVNNFNGYRRQMNDKLMEASNYKVLKRIFSVDTLACIPVRRLSFGRHFLRKNITANR